MFHGFPLALKASPSFTDGSLLELVRALAAEAATAQPEQGLPLVINSQSVGRGDYVIKDGNQTVSAFASADWFTAPEDDNVSFVIVKGDLTINSGQIFKPDGRKLLTVIYVGGDLVVNGEISMTGRGACHGGEQGIYVTPVAIRIATGTFGGVTDPQIPAAGGGGAAASTADNAPTWSAGKTGGSNSAGGTGGGGGGGAASGDASHYAQSGTGAAGTCFSGGSGGGGARSDSSGNRYAENAHTWGGKGGNGVGNPCMYAKPGAGNPVGYDYCGTPGDYSGTGGSLVIIVEGDISGSGAITADGMQGTSIATTYATEGGGSGGGCVTILYGTDTSSPTPTASGGAGGAGWCPGGAGGAGTARKLALA